VARAATTALLKSVIGGRAVTLLSVSIGTNMQELEQQQLNTWALMPYPAKETKMKQGDVVHLKSGSPELTVENVTGNFVKVIWFNDGVAESGTFDAACLVVRN
jgi:uncharacterized protein YodC (DUF2158 family)